MQTLRESVRTIAVLALLGLLYYMYNQRRQKHLSEQREADHEAYLRGLEQSPSGRFYSTAETDPDSQVISSSPQYHTYRHHAWILRRPYLTIEQAENVFGQPDRYGSDPGTSGSTTLFWQDVSATFGADGQMVYETSGNANGDSYEKIGRTSGEWEERGSPW